MEARRQKSEARGRKAEAGGPSAADVLDGKLNRSKRVGNAPRCDSFQAFLRDHAKVLQRDGTGGLFSMEGRAPLQIVVDWLDKILRNTLDGQTVEIDGVEFGPGKLKGATMAVGGGAQWGKTILELNLMAYATAIRFCSVGNYLPDRPKVEEIVGQKFRPNVLDLYPWMAEMIQVGKVQNASGKTIDRKESYTVTDGERKAFGNFCGMHKPPTSITIDLALLDEMDDIPDRNVGYVDARMTNSPVHLTCFIGTQRVAGAGQNSRLKASSFHVKMVPCPKCGREWCLEEEFPRCVRVKSEIRNPKSEGNPKSEIRTQTAGAQPVRIQNSNLRISDFGTSDFHASSTSPLDPMISPEMGHDRMATYYVACPECGAELDRDSGRYVAKHPERIAQARLGVRVSQLNISAISMQEIIGAWYAAFEDPSGNALGAFYCDRVAIPNAGAAQPITQAVLDDCRRLGLGETEETAEPYAMSLRSEIRNPNARNPKEIRNPKSESGTTGAQATGVQTSNLRISDFDFRISPRVAGMDMGPRCWFWCDEIRSPLVSACVWAELIASGNAPARVPVLMNALGIGCLFLDAGGEPDLTKRLVLALNGLENYSPPAVPKNELLKMTLSLGAGLSWDGQRSRWRGIRAAAVLFVSGEARGVEQAIGFTQEGRIYPLIKCNRGESIQTAVNDFLTPAEGVVEMIKEEGGGQRTKGRNPASGLWPLTSGSLRTLRRARLPQTYIGPGVSQAILDGHLLNLRKERDVRSGQEDWIEGVENHLGLAKCYARLAATLAVESNRVHGVGFAGIKGERPSIGNIGMGRFKGKITL
jgi:hypothetical protein